MQQFFEKKNYSYKHETIVINWLGNVSKIGNRKDKYNYLHTNSHILFGLKRYDVYFKYSWYISHWFILFFNLCHGRACSWIYHFNAFRVHRLYLLHSILFYAYEAFIDIFIRKTYSIFSSFSHMYLNMSSFWWLNCSVFFRDLGCFKIYFWVSAFTQINAATCRFIQISNLI